MTTWNLVERLRDDAERYGAQCEYSIESMRRQELADRLSESVAEARAAVERLEREHAALMKYWRACQDMIVKARAVIDGGND